jgi:hypothetical protein
MQPTTRGGSGGTGLNTLSSESLVGVGVKCHAFYMRPSHSARRLVGYGGCVLYKDDDDDSRTPSRHHVDIGRRSPSG